MKALTAGILALLTVVLVFFGFGLRANPGAVNPQATAASPQRGAEVRLQPVNGYVGGAQVVPVGTMAEEDAAQAPILVNCGPGTQTLVRPVWLNGQQVSQVECVPAAGASAGMVQARPFVQTVQGYGQVYEAPVVRSAPQYRPVTRRVEKPRRSWKKTALVIGGSTAAGAGVGGLIGGKKGALIGAAVGGGASTIYEAVKR
jgi:hypothetical protein